MKLPIDKSGSVSRAKVCTAYPRKMDSLNIIVVGSPGFPESLSVAKFTRMCVYRKLTVAGFRLEHGLRRSVEGVLSQRPRECRHAVERQNVLQITGSVCKAPTWMRKKELFIRKGRTNTQHTKLSSRYNCNFFCT